MDVTQERLPVGKGYDESLNDILSCLTSPRFCTKPWNSVTMSVGRDSHKKKNGIIHVHRTTLDDENLFDIKVHRCNKDMCDHDICSQSSIAVCDPNQVYPILPGKKRRRKRKRKAKALDLPKAVSTFPAERETEVACFGPFMQRSPFRESDSLCASRRTCCPEVKECPQDLRRKPSCILYVYSDGKKRKLSIELEPEIETFLARALDRIDNYSKCNEADYTREDANEEPEDDEMWHEESPSSIRQSTKYSFKRKAQSKGHNGSKYSYVSTKLLDESDEGLRVHRHPLDLSKKLYECHPGACLCNDTGSDEIVSKLSTQRAKKSKGRSTGRWSKKESRKFLKSNKISKHSVRKSRDILRSKDDFERNCADERGDNKKSFLSNSISTLLLSKLRPTTRGTKQSSTEKYDLKYKTEYKKSQKIPKRKSTAKIRQTYKGFWNKTDKPGKLSKRKTFICHAGVCGCCDSSSEERTKSARQSSIRKTSRVLSERNASSDRSGSISKSSSRASNFSRKSSKDKVQRSVFSRRPSRTTFVNPRESILSGGMLERVFKSSKRTSKKKEKSNSKNSKYELIEKEKSSIQHRPGFSKSSERFGSKETSKISYNASPTCIRGSTTVINIPRLTSGQEDRGVEYSERRSSEGIRRKMSSPYIGERTTQVSSVCREDGADCNPITCGCCSCPRGSGVQKPIVSQNRDRSYLVGSDRADSLPRSDLVRISTASQAPRTSINDQEDSYLNDGFARTNSVVKSGTSRLIQTSFPDEESNYLNDSLRQSSLVRTSQVTRGSFNDQEQSYPRTSSVRRSQASGLSIPDQESNYGSLRKSSLVRTSTGSQVMRGSNNDQEQSYPDESFPRTSSVRRSRASGLSIPEQDTMYESLRKSSLVRTSTGSQVMRGSNNDQEQSYPDESFPRTSLVRRSQASASSIPDRQSNYESFRTSSLVRTSTGSQVAEESIPSRAKSQVVVMKRDDGSARKSSFVRSSIDEATSPMKVSVSFEDDSLQPMNAQLSRASTESIHDQELKIPQNTSVIRRSSTLSDYHTPSANGRAVFDVDEPDLFYPPQEEYIRGSKEAIGRYSETGVDANYPTTESACCSPDGRTVVGGGYAVSCKCISSHIFSRRPSKKSVTETGLVCRETIPCPLYSSGMVAAPQKPLMCFCPQQQKPSMSGLGNPVNVYYSLQREGSPDVCTVINDTKQNDGSLSIREVNRNSKVTPERNDTIYRSKSSYNRNSSISKSISSLVKKFQKDDNSQKPKHDRSKRGTSKDHSNSLIFDSCCFPNPATFYTGRQCHSSEVYQTFEESTTSGLFKDTDSVKDQELSSSSYVHYVGYVESKTNSPFQSINADIDREVSILNDKSKKHLNPDEDYEIIVREPQKSNLQTNNEDKKNITKTQNDANYRKTKNHNGNCKHGLHLSNESYYFNKEHDQFVETAKGKRTFKTIGKCDVKSINSSNLHRTIAHAEVDDQKSDEILTKKKDDLRKLTMAIATKGVDEVLSELNHRNNTHRIRANEKVNIIDKFSATTKLQKDICSLTEVTCNEKSKPQTCARAHSAEKIENKETLNDKSSFYQCTRDVFTCTNQDGKKHGVVRSSTGNSGKFHFQPGDFPKDSREAGNLLVRESIFGRKNEDSYFADCQQGKHLFDLKKKRIRFKFEDPLVDPMPGFCPRTFL